MVSRGNSRRRGSAQREETSTMVNTVEAPTITLDTYVGIMCSVPVGLKIELEKAAAAAKAAGDKDASAGTIARAAIATQFGYTLPAHKGRKKSGLTDDEKKEQNKARARARQNAIDALMAQYGVVSDDDDEEDDE